MYTFDKEYCLLQLKNLLAIDSTTSQYEEIQKYMIEEMARLGYEAKPTHKGGLLVEMGGDDNALVVTSHLDDIGLMVRRINSDGTLNVCSIGGLYPFYCVMDNVRVYTRVGKVYTGCVCRTPNSIHVTEEELRDAMGDFRKNVCVVLDEDVKTDSDVRALGIETGDIIALDPRYTESNGYIKSRFIDDKACVALHMCAMKYIKDNNISLNRKVINYFAAYEEIGHGTTYLPDGVKDILAVDIAPTGPDQTSDEHKVTILCKDSRFPYHWGLTNEVREAALRCGCDFVMDVFTPHYGTDGDCSVTAGYDIRHAAIGPGTANSHGYERTHIDGLRNTYELLLSYLIGG